jgi:protein TonB
MKNLIWAARGLAVIGVLSAAAQPAFASKATDGLGATCVSRHVEAQPTRFADPETPIIASRLHEGGSVEVRVDLDETGTVMGTYVLASSGNAALDRAALKSIRASAFSPEQVDCKSVPGSYAVFVEFPN